MWILTLNLINIKFNKFNRYQPVPKYFVLLIKLKQPMVQD